MALFRASIGWGSLRVWWFLMALAMWSHLSLFYDYWLGTLGTLGTGDVVSGRFDTGFLGLRTSVLGVEGLCSMRCGWASQATLRIMALCANDVYSSR